MRGSAAQSAAVLQVSAPVPVTSAIVPAVPDIAIVPVASGVGSSTDPPDLRASPTRYRWGSSSSTSQAGHDQVTGSSRS